MSTSARVSSKRFIRIGLFWMSETKGRNHEDTNRGCCLSIALHPNLRMTVTSPETYSPPAANSAIAAVSADYRRAPFARASEADRICAPGYSWPPHLYQGTLIIKEPWNYVNQTLQAVPGTESGGSEVPGTQTPLVPAHLQEFFSVEQFTGWQGKVRLNLPGDLIRHIETHVGRQRTPTVQVRREQR